MWRILHGFHGGLQPSFPAGALMTTAERLAWLEEMLDELLPLVGRARAVERAREKTRG